MFSISWNAANVKFNVGKTITPFNVRLNNHRTDSNYPGPDTAPSDLHFSDDRHNVTRDASFTIIEKVKDFSKTDEEKGLILLKRENFWIKTLKTLKPKGLNQELNNV